MMKKKMTEFLPFLNMECYAKSPYYVGFFEWFEVLDGFSSKVAEREAMLWFFRNIYRSKGLEAYWFAWLFPKKQIVEEERFGEYLPLIRKMLASGAIMTRHQFLNEWGRVDRHDREFCYEPNVSIQTCVELMTARNFTNLDSQFHYVDTQNGLIFWDNEDGGFDIIAMSESARKKGAEILKTLRENPLFRCVVTCEGEYIDTNVQYPYEIKRRE